MSMEETHTHPLPLPYSKSLLLHGRQSAEKTLPYQLQNSDAKVHRNIKTAVMTTLILVFFNNRILKIKALQKRGQGLCKIESTLIGRLRRPYGTFFLPWSCWVGMATRCRLPADQAAAAERKGRHIQDNIAATSCRQQRKKAAHIARPPILACLTSRTTSQSCPSHRRRFRPSRWGTSTALSPW